VAFEVHTRMRSILLASFIGAFFLAGCSPSEKTFVRVASGPAGGYWYPLGAKQAEIFQREIPGVATSSAPGGGVGNIRDVANGEAEVGAEAEAEEPTAAEDAQGKGEGKGEGESTVEGEYREV